MRRSREQVGVALKSAASMSRPVGLALSASLVVIILLAPACLFRDTLRTNRLHSDDFAYLAASRSLDRMAENLFQPHNTHVVPAWRVLTWAVMSAAGSLFHLPRTLMLVAYGALVLTMLSTGLLVRRETGKDWLACAAMMALGTTSVMRSSATWYSSGQTLWAALGVLWMLLWLQAWRTRGGAWRLAAAAAMAWLAGAFWTIGHAAGPVGTAYLWLDERRRARPAAVVPLVATVLSIALAWSLGGRNIDARISFHGRSQNEAADARAGITHTLQSIPEHLVFENLGLEVETTPLQGAALSFVLIGLWVTTWRHGGRPTPMECAGATLLLLAYLVEWTFRGYLPFSSLRGVVPWYDTIPHVGFVLLLAGCADRLSRTSERPPSARAQRLTRRQALALLIALFGMAAVHTRRVETLFMRSVPALNAAESDVYRTHELQLARARYLAEEFASRQRQNLARLDQAQALARRLGVGRAQIAEVFGRIDALELPPVYDALGLLDLPWDGNDVGSAQAREALRGLLAASQPPQAPLRQPAP